MPQCSNLINRGSYYERFNIFICCGEPLVEVNGVAYLWSWSNFPSKNKLFVHEHLALL